MQAIAFIHGHERSHHSSNMQHMLRHLRWDQLRGYYDLNRVIGVWTAPLKNLSVDPLGDQEVLASGSDAYNGTFAKHQVPS